MADYYINSDLGKEKINSLGKVGDRVQLTDGTIVKKTESGWEATKNGQKMNVQVGVSPTPSGSQNSVNTPAVDTSMSTTPSVETPVLNEAQGATATGESATTPNMQTPELSAAEKAKNATENVTKGLYTIGTELGMDYMNQLKNAGDSKLLSDGTTLRREQDGSYTATKNGQTAGVHVDNDAVRRDTLMNEAIRGAFGQSNVYTVGTQAGLDLLQQAKDTGSSVLAGDESEWSYDPETAAYYAVKNGQRSQITVDRDAINRAAQQKTVQEQALDNVVPDAQQTSEQPGIPTTDNSLKYVIGSALGVFRVNDLKPGDRMQTTDGTMVYRNEDGSYTAKRNGTSYDVTIDRASAMRDPQWAVLTAPPATVDESDKGKSKSTSGSYSTYSAGTGSTASSAGTAKQGTSTATMDTATRRKLIASAEKEMNDLANQIKANKARGKDTRLLEQKYALAKSNVESLKSTKPEGATIQQQPTGRNLDIAAKKQLQEQVDAYGEAYRAAQAKKEEEKKNSWQSLPTVKDADKLYNPTQEEEQKNFESFMRELQKYSWHGLPTVKDADKFFGQADFEWAERKRQREALVEQQKALEEQQKTQEAQRRKDMQLMNIAIANDDRDTINAIREKYNLLDDNDTLKYLGTRAAGGLIGAVQSVANAISYLFQAKEPEGYDWDNPTMTGAQFDEAFSDLKQTYTFGDKAAQKMAQPFADKNVTPTLKTVGDVVEGAAGMIPSIGVNLAVPGSSLYVLFTQATGSATSDALQRGASGADAVSYGVANGLLEVATEKMFDGVAGVFGKGAADDVLQSAVGRITQGKSVQAALLTFADTLGEGFEEFVSEFGDKVLADKLLKDDNRTFRQVLGDAGESFLVGSLTSALMQVAGSITKKTTPKQAAQRVAELLHENVQEQITQTQAAHISENLGDTLDNAILETLNPEAYRAATAPAQAANAQTRQTASTQQNAATQGVITGAETNKDGNQSDTVKVVHNLQRSIPTLSKMDPCAVVSTKEVQRISGRTMAEKAKALFERITSVVTRPGFGDIEINKRAIKDDLSHGVGMAKAAVIPAIPSVLEYGTQIDYQQNWKGRNYDGYVFAAPITLDGETVYLAAVVRRTSKNTLYLHEVVDSNGNVIKIDDGIRANPTSLATNGDAGTQIPSSTITLSQPGQTVKPDVSATGSVGAMRSQFDSQQKQSQTQSNTINATEVRNNVPEAQRSHLYYDTISEKQSLYNARARLAQDYAGEVTELRGKHNWSGEEVDMGMAILDNYRRMAEQTGDWTNYSNWRKEVQRHGTAAGQALQAYAKYSRQTGGGIVADASSALERAAKNTNKAEVMSRVNELANRYDTAIGVGKENVEVNVDDLVEIIKDASATRQTGTLVGNKLPPIAKWAMNRIANYARAEAQGGSGKNLDFLKKFAADSIYNIAADTNKASVTEKIKETRRLGMLAKGSTVMRNLVSNNVFDPIDSIARNISIPLDMLISKFTGTRSIAYDASWFSKAKRKGSLDRFAQSCMEVGLDVNASGNQGRYENTTNRTFKMSDGVFSKLMSTWEAYEGYTLNATDEFQKGGIEASVQSGIDKLYEKGKIKDDSLRDAGRQEALYRTYQDKTVLSDAVIGVRNGLNKAHIGDIGLGDVVLPFAQVPSNFGARAIEYSPAGLLVSATDFINMIDSASKGEMTAAQQAKAVQGVGRALTGSAMIAIAAAGALRGWINVAGDDDDDNKEKLDETAGLNGTQLNISAALRDLRGEGAEWQTGDKLISIGFLDPINAQLTTGALIADDIQSEQLTTGRVFGNSVSGALQSVLDMPLMSVFRDIETAYKYSSGETDGERIIDTAARYAAGQVSSMVPNSLRGIAQGLDDTERDAYTSDNYWQQAVDNVKASIPGLRETLPAKTDPWGNEVKNEGGLTNFMNRNINPGNVATYTPDAVSSELESISEATGESLYPDRSAPKSITVDNQKIPLSYEQKNAYKAFCGSDYYKTVQGLMKNDNYLALPDEVKAEVLKQAESVATGQAKEMLGIGYEMQKTDRDIANMSGDDRGNALIAQAVKTAGYISPETQQQLDAVNKQYGSADYLGLPGDLFESARKRTQEFYEDVEASKYGGELSTTQQELLKKSPKEIAQHFIDNAVNAKYKNDTNGSGDRYDEILDAYKGSEVNDTVALAFLPDNTVENYRRYAGRNGVSTEMLLEAQHVKAGMSEKTDKDGKVTESVEDQFNAWLDTKTYWTANQKDGIRNSFYPDRTTIYKYLSKQMSTGKVSLNEIKKELTPTYQAGWSNNVKPAGVGMSTYIDCIVEYENRPNEEERKALNYNSVWEWYCDWLNTTDLTKDQKYAIAISARETGGEYSDKTKKKIYDRLK